MDILPILLLLLGVGFIVLGWRWQNPPNEEAITALKGLAYLKREIIRVQDHVYDLEGKLLESKVKQTKDVEQIEAMLKEKEDVLGVPSQEKLKTPSSEISVPNDIYVREKVKSAEADPVLSPNPNPNPNLSPKYQEVLELAASGQRIPDIASRLLLSQDAVKMVLSMQPNGGKNN
ncbi:hypothetical protein [Desulfosporosinus meridiei]|uniref:Response regulator containing a CheY-like receiver domain and an HTH DNA-binding domain n=1 Tax=Desulfosporosinus meridiei (strain ATCC BAA-275 / DSM 13257 / KCTC 12902 / NCIMB 13706 / S10) TaxID=768704 RepID=J7IKR5_DESMD|nr:hypothetical protein [Desulfosporosinus meridiei]AFQ42342.1 hypothetical protein Desmer_0280 [Desulfosporosinus meridiei DSM 13257]